MHQTSLITRSAANPILTGQDIAHPATLVFNAGVCKFNGVYTMVFRNDHGRWLDHHFDGTNLGLATSDDGVTWDAAPRPCIDMDQARRLMHGFLDDPDTQLKRFYDPRLTVLEGRVYMCFAVDTTYGLRGGLAVTDDFVKWQVLGLTTPDNRNHVLFPEKVGGRYFRLERPMLAYYLRQRHDMWGSFSPDLRHWGDSRLVLHGERVPFCNDKLGPGAPPVKTKRGWLTVFHTVRTVPGRGKAGWEDTWEKTYDAGLMLLDLDDPTKILGMVKTPLIPGEEVNEVGRRTPDDVGFRKNVIFPGGLILEPDGEVKVYYGADDTVMCLAIGDRDAMVEACLRAGP